MSDLHSAATGTLIESANDAIYRVLRDSSESHLLYDGILLSLCNEGMISVRTMPNGNTRVRFDRIKNDGHDCDSAVVLFGPESISVCVTIQSCGITGYRVEDIINLL